MLHIVATIGSRRMPLNSATLARFIVVTQKAIEAGRCPDQSFPETGSICVFRTPS
jgi:hypothetical protein